VTAMNKETKDLLWLVLLSGVALVVVAFARG
jgi:hypothetical protein